MLYMMDRAFDANPAWGNWHSFLVNLDSVKDEDWHWVPEDGKRSIFEIVRHVGMCKYVYDSHAFGDGSMRWDSEDSVPTIEPTTPRREVLQWLEDGQARLRSHVAELADDGELTALRPGNWGTQHETRWLLNTIIQHDLYHAGELNHIRALRQKNDD